MAKAYFDGTIRCDGCNQPISYEAQPGRPMRYFHLGVTMEPHTATPKNVSGPNWRRTGGKGGVGGVGKAPKN